MLGFHVLELCKSILDPIYGLVAVTQEELAVINSPIYQRLRKVKQNGMLHLVWPAATHTRFEHSVGALFVADSMLQSFLFNSAAAGADKLRDFDDADPGQAINFRSVSEEDRRFVFRAARLAALVHDLGHGPLSHTFDTFAPKIDDIRQVLEDSRFEALSDLRDVLLTPDRSQRLVPRVTHEAMSCIFFCAIWSELPDSAQKDPWLPKVVAAAILGDKAFQCLKENSTHRSWIPLIHDIVSSAPADADRMDYLERDSRSLGVTYGLFDRNRLLKSMLCYKSVSSVDAGFRLGWKRSGLRAVENFVQARFELFVQVYYHKTNRAISLMLEEISNLADKTDVDIFCGQSNHFTGLRDEYAKLSDDRFLSVLQGERGGPLEGHSEINTIARDVDERRLWKRIYEVQREARTGVDYGDPKEQADITRNKLKGVCDQLLLGQPCLPLGLDTYDPKATKDLEKGAVLLERDTNGFYSARSNTSWHDASPLIKVLSAAERSIGRIYLKDSNKDVATKLRKRAMQLDIGGANEDKH